MSKKESVDFEIRGVFVPWCFETLPNQEHTLIVVHPLTVDILISTVWDRIASRLQAASNGASFEVSDSEAQYAT